MHQRHLRNEGAEPGLGDADTAVKVLEHKAALPPWVARLVEQPEPEIRVPAYEFGEEPPGIDE